MNNGFKRIAAFALGLGGGLAAGYLSRPTMRNKLREQIVTKDSTEEENKKHDSTNETSSREKRETKKTSKAKVAEPATA